MRVIESRLERQLISYYGCSTRCDWQTGRCWIASIKYHQPGFSNGISQDKLRVFCPFLMRNPLIPFIPSSVSTNYSTLSISLLELDVFLLGRPRSNLVNARTAFTILPPFPSVEPKPTPCVLPEPTRYSLLA